MEHDASIDGEIARLGDLTRTELAARWRAIHGCPPPPGVRRELLSHAVAWDLQAKRFGGLSTAARSAIRIAGAKIDERRRGNGDLNRAAHQPDAAEGSPVGVARPIARSRPRPGARLIREWNGHTNIVDVTADGFRFEDRTYKSLSAIAREITGAHWSGPRFFGL